MKSTEIRRTFSDLTDKDIAEAKIRAFVPRMGNAKMSDWEDVLKSRLVLLLSEAQSGKTYECQTRQAAMWAAGEPAFYIELASAASQPWKELRSPAETERFERWRRTETEIATFFIDSIDELALTQGTFRTALRNVATDLDGHLSRARIVLTSRPLPVDVELFCKTFEAPRPRMQLTEDDFATLALGERREERKEGPPEIRYVSLLPLGVDDVEMLAGSRGVTDIGAFIHGLETSSMMEFMRRPQDVIEAASAWNELGGKFGTHAEQVAFDVRARLKPNPLRRDGQIEDDRAMKGAKRLALAVVLTQRLTIRHDVNCDVGDGATTIDPAVILQDWSDDDRKVLLQRGLFGFASYGRVRFHNRLAFEFLAANRLADLIDDGTSHRVIRRLLVIQTAQAFDVIRPSLRDVAAWLALRHPWVFELVRELEPALLMNLGDPGSLSIEQRQKVLTTYIERFGKGSWRGLSVPYIQINRLADASLGGIIAEHFSTIENPEVRQVLLSLIGHSRLHGRATILRNTVWDPQVDHYERCTALDALIALNDRELLSIVERLRDGPGPWDQPFARAAICRLFPRHMSVAQFAAVLGWIEETSNTVSELSRILPPLIEGLGKEPLEQLRDALTPLVSAGLVFDTNRHAAKNDRQHLVCLLATTCALLLKAGALPPALGGSVALVAQLARGIRSDESCLSTLSEATSSASSPIRAAVFAADVALTRRLRPDWPRLELFWQLAWHGPLHFKTEDAAWLRGMAGDRSASADERTAALQVCVFDFMPNSESRQAYFEELSPLVSDDKELGAYLEKQSTPPLRSSDERRWALCNQQRDRQQKRRKAKDRSSWVMFWRKLKDDAASAFSEEQAENTAWNLWTVMQRGGARSRSSGWDRQLIEEHLGREVADQLRNALLPLWRRESPPLASERPEDQRNTSYTRWILALAAITAEAEDQDWANRLTLTEAETAVRYAPLSTPEFPTWLNSLAATHAGIVERVLGGEITWLLSGPAEKNSRVDILQSVYHAANDLAKLFLPRLSSWIEDTGRFPRQIDDANAAVDRLNRVIEILLKFGDIKDRASVRDIAAAALAQGSNEPYSDVWLPALFDVDPHAAVACLETFCSDVEVSRRSKAVFWIAKLFGGARHGRGIGLQNSGITSDLLLRLIRLAYHHVERGKDEVHEGSYSPNLRDDAETGRGMLLSALVELGGPDGWAAKQEIAGDPNFAHLRDRLHVLAVEKSARESDSIAMRPEEVVKFDERKEPGPRSSAEMFALMKDRLEDVREHLLTDTSLREIWALIKVERLMRHAIAYHLENRAYGAYSVAQENVTADEKETDIRLRSSVNEIEGVIELKIGDKGYSAATLRAVLSEQLVKKYLAPAGRRAGFLLVTRMKRDVWQHPDTGTRLDFDGLITLLKAEAKVVQERFPDEIYIDVVGLDLRPRLTTEREANAAKWRLSRTPKEKASHGKSKARKGSV